MQIITTIFGPLYDLIVNALVLIYIQLSHLGVPGALGFSIMILTIIIRLLVWPFVTSQLKSTKKMADLKPHLDALKEKHKGDANALRLAQTNLYKEHGVNPAAGCLPSLIQLPVLIALYQAILHVFPSTGGSLAEINKVLYFPWMHLSSIPDPSFFGVDIAMKPAQAGLALIWVPVLTAFLTFIQIKMSMPKQVKVYPTDSTKEKKEKESMEDMMSGMQSQMLFLMPLMIGYFGYNFPVGLAIYWNTVTILGIAQQYRLSGWGGLADLKGILNGRKTK